MNMNVLIDLISREVSGAFEKAGFDPAYGARPLKRLIQHEIVDRAANEIVGGNLSEGDTIVIDLVDFEFTTSVRHSLAK